MSLAKKSQLNFSDLDGISVPVHELPKDDLMSVDDIQLLDLDEDTDEPTEFATFIIEDEPKEKEELSFVLPHVPGGEDQSEISVEEPSELSVDENPDNIEVVNDPKKWKVETFMKWLHHKMNTPPGHSGRDTTGLERVVSYFESLDREISKAVRMDIDGILDIDALEPAREEIHKAIQRCLDRLEKIKSSKYPGKKKKKADEQEDGLVKEAGTTRISGITISVPLFISSLARSIINGTVSAGHDIDISFTKLAKEYNLSNREKLELIQLVSDMGYPIRRDLGMPLDKEIDTTSSDNINWSANFPG